MIGHADDWIVYLRPMPSETPAAIRIRTLLKRARRDLHILARLVRDPTPAEVDAANMHDASCDCWQGLSCNCPCDAATGHMADAG